MMQFIVWFEVPGDRQGIEVVDGDSPETVYANARARHNSSFRGFAFVTEGDFRKIIEAWSTVVIHLVPKSPLTRSPR